MHCKELHGHKTDILDCFLTLLASILEFEIDWINIPYLQHYCYQFTQLFGFNLQNNKSL